MRIFLLAMVSSILALCAWNVAWAADDPGSGYEYTADEIAENQGAVAYWYAWGFNYAYGHFPASFAEMKEHDLPLRGFFSPHSDAEINFDDGSLDFDGDMTYARTASGVEIQIQTTHGKVVLPGMLNRTNECGEQFCCEIMICKEDCWDICSDQDAACKIMQWMMWKSFESHECRYGYRPVDEKAWMESGFSPIESDWRTRYTYMDIKLVYGQCALKKAIVNCCAPCPQIVKCAVTQPCGKCNECLPVAKPVCKSKCQPKCNECLPVAKPVCESKCKTKCNECLPVLAKPVYESKCNKCKQNTCTSCKSKSDNCSKCQPKCESTCGTGYGQGQLVNASNCVTCIDVRRT